MIPAFATTMIGSMPQAEPEDVFKIYKDYPLTIPCWPQLPQTSFKEAMIPQYSQNFPGMRIDDRNKRIWLNKGPDLAEQMADFFEKIIGGALAPFALTDNFARGFSAFTAYLSQSSQKYDFVKGQITGPFTFGLGLNDQEGRPIWFDEQYREIIINGLAFKALWQAKQLKQFAANCIIFMDEPILSALGTPAYMGIEDQAVVDNLNHIAHTIQAQNALAGVHCCGNMDWGLLAKTDVDIINFDAYFYSEKVALYPAEINGFLERGGILAWGIVPTGNAKVLHKESAGGLKIKLEDLFELFTAKGIDGQKLKRQIILTPSCGMGSGALTAGEAELVLKLLYDLHRLLSLG